MFISIHAYINTFTHTYTRIKSHTHSHILCILFKQYYTKNGWVFLRIRYAETNKQCVLGWNKYEVLEVITISIITKMPLWYWRNPKGVPNIKS